MPALCQLDGMDPFGMVSMAWNQDGLFVSVSVSGKQRELVCDPKRFWKSDHLRLCIGCRDTRSIKRATRFCHQFYLLPTGAGPKTDQPVAGSHKIQRARDDAPTVKPGQIKIKSTIRKNGYWLGAHIPANCLNGFDPAEHPRLGFYYMLEDRELGQQYLTVGDDLYWYVDPSTWATAVLTD